MIIICVPILVLFVTYFVVTIVSDDQPPKTSNMSVFTATEYYNISDKPVLANGHIGYVPYSDSIYMNGVFNGQKGSSHRARIPNYANIYVENCGPSSERDSECEYELDVQKAAFVTEATVGKGNDFHVRQTQYAHRYYDSVIVNTIQMKRNSVNSFGE